MCRLGDIKFGELRVAKEMDEDEGNFALLKLKEIGDDDLFLFYL